MLQMFARSPLALLLFLVVLALSAFTGVQADASLENAVGSRKLLLKPAPRTPAHELPIDEAREGGRDDELQEKMELKIEEEEAKEKYKDDETKETFCHPYCGTPPPAGTSKTAGPPPAKVGGTTPPPAGTTKAAGHPPAKVGGTTPGKGK